MVAIYLINYGVLNGGNDFSILKFKKPYLKHTITTKAVILMEGGTKEDLVVLDIKDDISAMPASAATPATTTTILAATTTTTPASTTKASSVKGDAKSAEAAVMKADGGDGDGGRVDGGEKVDGDREQDGGKTDEVIILSCFLLIFVYTEN